MASQTEAETVKGAAYGRFSRRLRAVVIDGIIISLMLVGALSVAVAAESDKVGRIVGITFVASWLLYELCLFHNQSREVRSDTTSPTCVSSTIERAAMWAS